MEKKKPTLRENLVWQKIKCVIKKKMDKLKILMEKATVELPKSLSLAQFEKMLIYIAKNVPADINYRASYFGDISRLSPKKGTIDYGSVEVGGMMRSRLDVMAFDSFITSVDDRDYRKISKMRFNLIPGYEEEEDHRPEVRNLWLGVRQAVQKYFSERRRRK